VGYVVLNQFAGLITCPKGKKITSPSPGRLAHSMGIFLVKSAMFAPNKSIIKNTYFYPIDIIKYSIVTIIDG